MGSRRNLEDQERSFKAVDEEEGDEEEEEKEEEEEELVSKRIRAVGNTNSFSPRKKAGSSGGSNPGGWVSTARAVNCQADNCKADMTEAKRYHRRHKVCELHFKAPAVLITGIHRRFCQQCSRSEALTIINYPLRIWIHNLVDSFNGF